jgi:hypothetical protein
MKTLGRFRIPGSRFNEKIHSDNPERVIPPGRKTFEPKLITMTKIRNSKPFVFDLI